MKKERKYISPKTEIGTALPDNPILTTSLEPLIIEEEEEW